MLLSWILDHGGSGASQLLTFQCNVSLNRKRPPAADGVTCPPDDTFNYIGDLALILQM